MSSESNAQCEISDSTPGTQHKRFSNLLLVEDNDNLRVTLTDILEDEGFNVIGCATAGQALECFPDHDFAIAVIDLQLPDKQGTEVLKGLRDLGSHIPVIINTGYGAFDSAKDAVNFGAFAYIEKAGDPEELVRHVHRARQSYFERYIDDLEAAVAERSTELVESEEKFRLLFENSPVSLWHEDLSELKQRIEELRQNGTSDFRQYFESNPDAVIDCWKRTKVLDLNRATLKLHNATTKSELFDSLNVTFCEESMDVFREEIIALANGESTFESEAIVQTLDGEKRNIMLRMFVAPDSPDWSNVYVVLTDVTEQKRAADENLHLQTQLRHSQKMDAVGQLAAGVAHEFNNILVGILGNVELLRMEDQSTLPDHFDQSLQDVQKSGERAAKLTKQLLSFSRKKPPNKSLFEINALISDRVEMLQRLIGQRILLTHELHASALWILAEEADVEAALVNLVMNARDALATGGNITIQSESVQIDATDDLPNCEPGQYVKLTVSDDGCGMPPEVAERVFEPFFTTKQVGDGTGLGLSTVFADIAKSDGFVSVDSKEGQGTHISILLPQAQTPVANHAAVEQIHTKGKAIGGNETVLVCDDEEIVLDMFCAVLKKLGYTVIRAQGPQEAIQLANAHKETISLLLSDVSMPSMNGIQLVTEIKKLQPDIKVVLASGYAQDILVSHPQDNHDFEFLQKPSDMRTISRIVRSALN